MPVKILTVLVAAGSCLAQESGRFTTWETCARCHTDIAKPAEAAGTTLPPSIGPAALWVGSMMAHSARDPYWRAKVRFESASAPSHAGLIQDTCLRCHAPMQQYDLRATSTQMALNDLNALGKEGVGCTVCHQITSEGLGKLESFEANFRIHDGKLIYGPHANPYTMPMFNQSGYTATEGQHIMESAVCGTCHTVITPILDAQEQVKGEFVEQAPFLEWLASQFPQQGTTCQSCHMPVVRDAAGKDLPLFIAHQPNGRNFPPTAPRTPFGLHFLAGGNVPMLNMLIEENPQEQDPLQRTKDYTARSLERAISLEASGALDAATLRVSVTVRNRTGHKLPTAYPSRRIWLRLTVKDRTGNTIFESGAWDPKTGEIAGVTGPEPHRNHITDASQTAIYETELLDLEGNPTVSLLRAAAAAKDNRVLPAGFDLTRLKIDGLDPSSIQPAGVEGDEDFVPGSDVVRYSVPVAGDGPFDVEVEALYQSVKPSHAKAMDADRSSEERHFLDLFSRHNGPVRMARKQWSVQR